jgi:deazaflavin-dependent oxidoreductase (nitroreductase family)
MTQDPQHDTAPRLPPKAVIHLAWRGHRLLYRLSRGRYALRRPRTDRWGTMRLSTVGRHSGQQRSVILAYLPDGPNLVTLAMNGWDPAQPAWWLNLQQNPQATVDLPGAVTTAVTAREAVGEERTRLWELYRQVTPHLDQWAARRGGLTPVVVLQSDPNDTGRTRPDSAPVR